MDFNLIWKGCLIVGSIIIAAASAFGLITWRHDNRVEELAEYIVRQQTGFDIDLSPTSPDQIERARMFLEKHKLDMVITNPFSGDDEIAGI